MKTPLTSWNTSLETFWHLLKLEVYKENWGAKVFELTPVNKLLLKKQGYFWYLYVILASRILRVLRILIMSNLTPVGYV
jgi:hypothetical protein